MTQVPPTNFPFLFEDRQWRFRDSHESLQAALYQLLITCPGERLRHPDFGCDIHRLPPRAPGPRTEALLALLVNEALTRHLPALQSPHVTVQNRDEHDYLIQVEGLEPESQRRCAITIPFSFVLP